MVGEDVLIRAVNLGGYGDVASAQRMASHLQQRGISSALFVSDIRTSDVLDIIGCDVPYYDGTEVLHSARIILDTPSVPKKFQSFSEPHYVPHLLVQDMNKEADFSKSSGLFLQPGFERRGAAVIAERFGGYGVSPLFHRPYHEQDLPMPGEFDARQILLSHDLSLESLVSAADKIMFMHVAPSHSALQVLSGSYLRSVGEASKQSGQKYFVGIIGSCLWESELRYDDALSCVPYSVRFSDGQIRVGANPDVLLSFLGSFSQVDAESLFISASAPCIMTGNLSLSDAMYSLMARKGQGFFYDAPIWERNTFRGLINALGQREKTAQIFIGNSMKGSQFEQEFKSSIFSQVFYDDGACKEYSEGMRDALWQMVERLHGAARPSGLSFPAIPYNSSFIIEDAAEAVVRTLLYEPGLLAEINARRQSIVSGQEISAGLE